MNKKSAIDLTTGSILGKLIPFTLPVLLGNVLQECYSLVDTLIVGQALGVGKLAAVGLTAPLSFFIVGFCVGLSAGCTVPTSQYTGAGDKRKVKESVAAHMIISLVAAIVITIAGGLLSRQMLTLMNTSADLIDAANIYIKVIFLGAPATIFYNFISSVLRAAGDSKTPLYLLILSSVLNIGLDVLMIVVFHWDVAGAAIATVAAQLISAVLCYIYVAKKYDYLLPDRESWRSLGRMISEEVKIGIPMGIQLSIVALGMLVLQYVLNGFGADAVAAYTVSSRVLNLCQNPMISIGNVVAVYVGQNMGAGNYKRIRQGVNQMFLITVALSIFLAAIIIIFAKPITTLFVNPGETEVIAYVTRFLYWNCPFLWILAFMFIPRGAIQGMGDGFVPMIGGIIELIIRAVVPIFLAGSLDFVAICIANPAAWAGGAILCVSVYLIRAAKFKKRY